MQNSQVSTIFREIASMLKIKGDNPFRIRAYERAAENIDGLREDLETLAGEGRLSEIPGIGQDLSSCIEEFLKKGKMQVYERLKKSLPQGLLELLRIPSLGPKTVKLLYEELKITGIKSLKKAIAKNRLQGIYGIKEKTVENILKGIALVEQDKERMHLPEAIALGESIVGNLKASGNAKAVIAAGSLRRKKETVRDIDILALSDNPKQLIRAFCAMPMVKDVLASGTTKAAIRTKENIQVDCRIVEDRSFGAALIYFTGSKSFNIKLRQLAIKKGLKINEYGVFSVKGKEGKPLCGKTEEEVFKILGMPYIEPELREDTGEIELAREGRLPELVTLQDIRGDLHVHSRWSDGNNTIEEIALACKKRGYSYVAVTDHSQSLKIAGGLSIKDLKKKREEISGINKRLKSFRVLYAVEADIDAAGDIDYPENILKEFDLVIAAIHSGFKQSPAQLTRRITRACSNKHVHIIAHPTGRLWGTRAAYALNIREVFKAARDTNTAMEINSFPQRLDLNDAHCRQAKEAGVKLAINTDTHAIMHLGNIGLGVAVARRGWLTKKNVINALPLEELLKTIKK